MLTNPYMLGALIALTIPWIIEWLFRRKRRIVNLPTIRFLLDAEKQSKVRLQDLILLYLRTLVVLLLVLALLRPILHQDPLKAAGGKKPHVLLIFDGTYSNAQKVGAETSFTLAKKIGNEVVGGLPKGTLVTLAVLEEHEQVVKRAPAAPTAAEPERPLDPTQEPEEPKKTIQKVRVELEASEDLPAVAERIRQLEPTDKSGSMMDAIIWAEAFMKEKNVQTCEAYVLSDMQGSSWKARASDGTDMHARFAQFCEKNRVFFADTGGRQAPNYYVTEFKPRESLIAARFPTLFDIRVEGTNTEEREKDKKLHLVLYVDGAKQAARQFVAGAGSHTATFEYTFPRGGSYVLKVALTGDEHLMDNERQYIATVLDSHRVLLVDDEADQPSLERESGWVELAISPPEKPTVEKMSLFRAEVCLPEKFADHNLSDYKAAVLANLGAITPQIASALESFVAEGGALAVLLGDHVSPYDYNKLLYKKGAGLLPCGIVEEKDTEPSLVNEAKFHLSPEAQAIERRLADTSVGGIRKYLKLDLQGTDKEAGAVAAVQVGASNAPLVVVKPFGRGRVLLFAGSAHPDWGDLPATGEFVVIVQEVLRWMIGEPDRGVNLQVGDVFRQPVLMASRHLVLKRPEGRKDRMTPRRAKGEKIRHVTYTNTSRRGLYEVETIPEVMANRRFVVNLVPSEPELTPLAREAFQARFGRPELTFLPSSAQVRRYVKEMHAVKEAAGALLAALFIALGVEMFLAVRFGSRRT